VKVAELIFFFFCNTTLNESQNKFLLAFIFLKLNPIISFFRDSMKGAIVWVEVGNGVVSVSVGEDVEVVVVGTGSVVSVGKTVVLDVIKVV
jgi:hypothetical protein